MLFLNQPIKIKYETYATGNLLYFSYYANYYKLINIDLSRQENANVPRKINFTGNLEENEGAKMFFIAESQQKTILNLSLDSIIIKE